MFSQIKDRKHIEQNFILLSGSCARSGTWGAGWVKNFSLGICDGAPSTARSSLPWNHSSHLMLKSQSISMFEVVAPKELNLVFFTY